MVDEIDKSAAGPCFIGEDGGSVLGIAIGSSYGTDEEGKCSKMADVWRTVLELATVS